MSDQENLCAVGYASYSGAVMEALQREVADLFNRLPLEKQPNVIVDSNFNNEIFLSKIFNFIRAQTARGCRLQEVPIHLVGIIDSNKSGQIAKIEMADSQQQVYLIFRDEKQELGRILETSGSETEPRVLYLQWCSESDAETSDVKNDCSDLVKLVGNQFCPVDSSDTFPGGPDERNSSQRLFHSLGEMNSTSRFIVARTHGAPHQPDSDQVIKPETCDLNAVFNSSQERQFTADAYISVAASQGYFNDGAVWRYPKGPELCQISLHSFIRRDYIVRNAVKGDLDRLSQLEELCWQHTRSSKEQILARLQMNPEGQFVLEKNGSVLGVLYSQRIASTGDLMGCTAESVHELHDPSGAIIQLLAVNIDPDAQNVSYGDQLLEFMLQRCGLMAGVRQVVGVTLCKHYNADDAPFDEYIQRQDGSQDPVLTFHQAHGAKIVTAIPGYRPDDHANLCNGVLVAYDIVNRIQRRAVGREKCVVATTDGSSPAKIARRDVQHYVQAEAARRLKIDAKQCALDRPLMEMGLDSADLLSLQKCIEEQLGIKLGGAFFFENNNLHKVITYLEATSGADTEVASVEEASSVFMPEYLGLTAAENVTVSLPDLAIAIVGISCKLPGGIESPSQLWRVLASEKCVIEPYPRGRGSWPASGERPGIDQGGFVCDVDAFDNEFFRISPTEAQRTDPQQRILLQLAWACFEDAGIVPASIKGTDTGVFIGASNCDYSRLIRDAGLKVEAHHGVGNSLAVLANRLSYFFDFSGPSMVVDTACSSSLVALHTAIQSLRSGECGAALVGGVNLICHPDISVAYDQSGMLAPDGKCKVFDIQANGYVRSEGAVLLLLKPLKKAVTDGDRIHAVIRGSAINHGGLSGGLTVPNPQKQSILLQAAWKNAGIHPDELSYIEAHGTGTSLGDPIEVYGIMDAYNQLSSSLQSNVCGIGSVKSNLGHLESAAGITGLLKVVLSMQHGQLPASIHFQQLNPKINLEGSRFYIQNRLCDWHVDGPRIAGVSSFGSGGANAHVVVQECAPTPRKTASQSEYLFVLSAVDVDRLQKYVARGIDWLENTISDEDFADAIYTWQTGRTAMRKRLAIKTTGRMDLLGKMKEWLDDGKDTGNVWSGHANPEDADNIQMWRSTSGRMRIDQELADKNLEQLASIWTSGVEVDWQKLHESSSAGARRITLPTYPFAESRHWIDVANEESSITAGSKGSEKHQMVRSSIADCQIGAGETIDCFLLNPIWQPQLHVCSLTNNIGSGNTEHCEWHIVLCELSTVEAETLRLQNPNSHCVSYEAKGENIAQRYSRYTLACFEMIQGILLRNPQGMALLQLVVPCDGEQILFAGLSGLLKTAALESSHFIGQLLLVPTCIAAEELSSLLKEEIEYGADSLVQDMLVKYEGGVRHVQRWEEEPADSEEPPIGFREHGVYLITGGLGGLGMLFTHEIIARTRECRVVLSGRSELNAEKQVLLSSQGRVSYRQVDLSDLDEVKELITSIQREHGRLDGILHSAGMIADDVIVKKTIEQVTEVLSPKVTGTYNLDQAAQGIDLDLFVLFSSIAGATGTIGQADYAAANGFMDQFAVYRNTLVSAGQRCGRTRSINWPLWKAGGMGIDLSTQELLRQTTGIEAMNSATGMDAFYRCLERAHDRMLVIEGNRSKIVAYLEKSGILEKRAGAENANHSVSVDVQSNALNIERLQQQLKTILARVLRIEALKIDMDRAFVEFGLDSFLGAETMVAINNLYGMTLSNIKLYDYSTVRKLAQFLEEEIKRMSSAATVSVRDTLQASSASISIKMSGTGRFTKASRSSFDEKIAIVGMSGRYPKASNLDQYWDNLANGRNSVEEVPPSRWDVNSYYDPDRSHKNKTYSKWLGALDEIDSFDPLFFRISPQEAAYMDPQHRLFLEESYKAFEDAGYCSDALGDRKCGVYLGITNYEYMLLLSRSGVLSPPITSNNVAIAAARIAYHLNLKGPAISVDTACSSSLVAMHLACQALLSGEIDMALAGGVALWLAPESYIAMSDAGMLSPVGQCKAFDDTADGMVNAEGVGVVVLKRLSDAEADGDMIHGVILASGINQDGRTNGITAPSVLSQIELERSVYSKHEIDPETITCVEAHGTGTRLGDPIELEALTTVFREKTTKIGFCALGSVKSNIGHTTAAAGVAGVQKILLSLRHQTLVPSLHVTKENSHFDFKNSPFYISREKHSWIPASGHPRRAAVSSFGFSGTNAHMVIEEYTSASSYEPSVVMSPTSKVAIPLSARKPEQLKQKTQELLDFIRNRTRPINLVEMAYTLQVGREPMDERVGFIVESVEQLTEKLEAYLFGEQESRKEFEEAYQGHAKRDQESFGTLNCDKAIQNSIVEKYITQGRTSKLLEQWVKGLNIEWGKLYRELRPRRMSLPTYPFARDKYWLPMNDASAVEQASTLPMPDVSMLVDSKLPARPIPWSQGRYWKSKDELLVKVLWRQLRSLGLLDDAEFTIQQWKISLRMPALYERWLHETLVLLGEWGVLRYDGSSCTLNEPPSDEMVAWEDWEREKAHWLHDPNLKAHGLLLEATLRALPDILTGKRKATEVLFPGSSMEMVEGVYKNNSLSDYFNEVLADVTVAYLEERRQRNPESRIRILEIGAGTGGSSALLFKRLAVYSNQIEEYCYSDLSRAFLVHGENEYGASNPFVTYRLFNVESHPAGQGIELGAYDLVIATNVLHATKNIRTTLNHAKATLKPNGILLLNEMAEQSLFTHLTFGLLEGWWLSEDEALRIRGCPALDPAVWKKVLEQGGFRSVFFPAHEAHALGQQIIVAEYEGAIRDVGQASLPNVSESVQVKSAAMHMHRGGDSGSLPERVHNFLTEAVMRLMKVKMEDIDLDAELSTFGFDSIGLAGLSRFLNQELLLSLEPSVFFANHTIRTLGAYLATAHAEALSNRFHSWTRAANPLSDTRNVRVFEKSISSLIEQRLERSSGQTGDSAPVDAVAIIGMSGCFPQAEDVDAFWENLLAGKDCIRAIPKERWEWPFINSEDAASVQWAGLMDGIDEFDPLFFGISPREAELMDPQQRLLMTHVWKVIEDAGYSPQSLSGSNTALLVGTINSGYCELISKSQTVSRGDSATGTVPSIGPNRMSYLLNLHGPSEPIETACSSALVAIHRGCDLITSGKCAMAIVGGVNVLVSPESHLSFSQAGMLSEDGRCKTFSATANGYVRGEGAGMLMLKSLKAAERDGDHIYAVVRGSAENHGGRANSLTAPNPKAQAELLKAAYSQAGIDCRSVGYIEAHGTGTALGDPIEISGLKSAFEELCRAEDRGPIAHPYCGLGSVKTNIGHLELAAGAAGVIKVVLQFQHKTLVKSLHCDEINPYIQLDHTPFYIVRENREWLPLYDGSGMQLPRRAGVSSFGFGGVNAHVVLEEYVPRPSDRLSDRRNANAAVIVLSARTDERLQEQAKRLHSAISAQGLSDADLEDLAYTLQVGREAMECRLAMVVRSIAEVQTKLYEYLEGKQAIEDFYRGEVKRNKEALAAFKADEELQEAIAKWIHRGKLSKLLGLWVKGVDFDWNELYQDRKPRRISLPTYPFAKERYWVDMAGSVTSAKGLATAAASVLHPLLHMNTSDLNEQRYTSTFTGEEFFFADHRIRTGGSRAEIKLEKVLPGVAYLEMARAAVEQALPSHQDSDVFEMHNIVWAQPVTIVGSREVHIALLSDESGQIDCEVYSYNKGTDDEILHCQGRALWSQQIAPAMVDIKRLQEELREGKVEVGSLYAAFEKMGVTYGPSFKSVTALDYANNEVLARLRLPSLQDTQSNYVLHPSGMDGALQACAVLMDGWPEGFQHPRLPFALDAIRVFSPCEPEMFVWARYSAGSRRGDNVLKMDIDLCGLHGTVCVQMHGLSWRMLSQEDSASHASETLLATPVWRDDMGTETKNDYEQHHILLCELFHVEERLLESMVPGSKSLTLRSGEDKDIAQRYSEYALACFEYIRSILQARPRGNVLVQVVVGDQGEQAIFAGMQGLLKTAAQENPLIRGQVIFVSNSITTDDLGWSLAMEKSRGLDSPVRYEGSARRVLHWQEVTPDIESPMIAFKDQGVYLITGGMGGLGLLFAKEILEKTRDARVVLTGRSELTPDKQARIDGLAAQTGRVSYRRMQLGDGDEVTRCIAAMLDEYGRLDGILHGAGAIADSFIIKKTCAEFNAVLEPKVRGCFNLDRATEDVELDFFVLFSSLTSVIGNLGQADYAAANGFLDEFAAYRNALVSANQRHGRTRAIHWPLWQDGGMKIDSATRELLRQSTGIEAMKTATGMRAFYCCLAFPCNRILVAEGNLGRMRSSLLDRPELLVDQSVLPHAQPALGLVVGSELESLQEKTQDYLRRQLSGLLKLPSHKIDSQAVLEHYGIDSILAIKMINELEKRFGSLPKTLFFEYQTLGELSKYFLEHYSMQLGTLFDAGINGEPTKNPAIASTPAAPRLISSRRFHRAQSVAHSIVRDGARETEPIAMIGLSGRYPQAVNIEAYWRNLRDGRDCIVEVPKDRWDWREYFSEDRTKPGHHYSKWGGFIEGVDEFDPLFFNISPKEAETIDPQERLFLQHAWMAIEDAGYTRAGLQSPCEQDIPGQVGVYAGMWFNEYQLFGAESSLQGKRIGVSGSMASIANRVSYTLNLHGPSMTVDTMCSSSLTAIHTACMDLNHGRTSMAIAGGVNVNIHPNKYLVLSALQAISTGGRCQSFGEGGDGYIPSEGVGVVVLKRLSDAERDGDHIYGVIRGSALNHGGKTNGYTVPNPQAQTSSILRALSESHTDPRHISYIEAHGTGTKLGDPIEVAALTKAFRQYTLETEFCRIGSSKSNIGHTESAAGIAGLTKVLLQMQHRQIVPSLHSAQLNPYIDFDGSPFVVNQQLSSWEQPEIDGRRLPRIAGISSFGAGGSNAHMIVEEYSAAVVPPISFVEVVILLSARTAEQLRQKAHDLLEYLRARQCTIDLVSVAYTLQVGREAMEERLGFVVGAVEQAVDKLEAYLSDRQVIDELYQGQVKRNKEALSLFSSDVDLQQTVEKWIANKKYSKLLDLWSKGLEVDWSKLYGDAKPKRTSLPVYPFSKDRYWIPKADVAQRSVDPSGTAAVLHPMLHRNTSDLAEQRFTSVFTGEEFFFADHVVKGQRVLPGVAYLEMARAAVEQAIPDKKRRGQTAGLRLKNVVWVQPVRAAGEAVEVQIGLTPLENGEIDFSIYSMETPDGEKRIVHSQGRALLLDSQRGAARVDLASLQGAFKQRVLGSDEFYEALRAIGLQYGSAHRALEALYIGTDDKGNAQALAKLKLPGCVADGQSKFVLHPCIMDAALQASLGLMMTEDGRFTREAWLPFSLEKLDILRASPMQAWAWIRSSGTENQTAEQAGEGQKVDVDLCDEEGRVCVQFRGLTPRALKLESREETSLSENVAETGVLMLAPVWDATPLKRIADFPSTMERLAIIGGSEHEQEAIRLRYPQAQTVLLWPSDTVEYIAERMKASEPWDHLLWIVPDGRTGSSDTDSLDDSPIEGQKHGVLFCFRLFKALLELGYGAKKLGWTIITREAQAILKEEIIDSTHASIHGLIGSMAKEYPNWKLRLVDIEKNREWPWDEILKIGADPQGDAWVHRQGEWYRQMLVRCEIPALEKSLYRTGGVYVVIGGAGGVGEVYSEYLIQKYQAHVIWIGRREKDARIADKIERLSRLGPAPEYIQADATSYEQLQSAYRHIRASYGVVHAVIHSVLQLLDKSLWQMEEERFHLALAGKVDTSVRMAQVFGKDELDFVLFFSSVQSFYKTAGQSNYAAGCTFVDAYAHELGRQWGRPVKVMNWGYWGEVGVVATEAHRQRMAQAGLGSIGAEEGMLALDQLLANPLSQTVFMKVTSAETIAMVHPQDALQMTSSTAQSVLNLLETNAEQAPPELVAERVRDEEFETLLGKILLLQLDSIGAFSGNKISEWHHNVGVLDLYIPWFEESLRSLADQRYIYPAGDGWRVEESVAIELPNAWKAWESWKQTAQDIRLAAQARLVEATLRALPEILLGRRLATEILFPNSGMELVEGIYKNNALADYFNHALAAMVAGYVDERVKHDRSTRIRILEIGAGTGGSSASIFNRLEGREEHIEEYTYTDLSKAFLFYAEEQYGKRLPYLKCQQFDVERTLSDQEIEAHSYDVVVAGNVLHATKNIRQTLRNAKALLKCNGVLLLNELTEKRLFAHLTFGLTEGWWRFEDAHLRLQGTPSLSPSGWHHVLQSEGFGPVIFPVHGAAILGQQILAAESDGVLRQQRALPRARSFVSAQPTKSATVVAQRPAWREADNLKDRVLDFLVETVSEMMKVKVEDIDLDAELSLFGFDSITLTGLSNSLNVQLQMELMPSIFFQYPTLGALGEYLVDQHRDVLGKKFETWTQPVESVAVQESVKTAEGIQLASKSRFAQVANPTARTATETNEGFAERVYAFLIEAVSQLMKVKAEEIDLDAELSLFGFDSITLTGFSNYLNQELQLELMPSVFFENPTLRSLGTYLVAKHRNALGNKFHAWTQVENDPIEKSGAPAMKQVSFTQPSSNRRFARSSAEALDAVPEPKAAMAEPVAIIGMSGCFPQAEDIDAFWRNLSEGKDCISELPQGRWEWPAIDAGSSEDFGKTHIKWGGFIDGVDEFDPLFFGISPREAELMDPQQRLLMAHVWKAIEDAGYSPQSLSGSNTALLVGTVNSGYGIKAQDTIRGDSTTAWVASIGPNRMSYLLNLHGPSEPIETACSSSLIAIHRGRELVSGGHCELAIVGGVNTLMSPETHVGYARAGLLSEDGRCKTFSAKANGYVRGEGVGMLVLKRLKAAERDGDHIYGLLRGSGENHGGRSNSLTAPNPKAQAELLKHVYTHFDIDCRSVSYIEAHGTGTALGDPIEIDGLKSAFNDLYEAAGRGRTDQTHCGLGAVKTNIGHLELASGVAGVIKVLLQFRHKTLVKTLHCDEINPYIQLEGSPFYIVRDKQEWRRPCDEHGQEWPRRAGVSSFGFGGVNAHIVLEEYVPRQSEKSAKRAGAGPVVIVLSARNEDRLREQAKRLHSAFAALGLGDADLDDCAYTLQVGREAMEYRIAMVVGSIKEAQEKLQEFLDGKQAIKDFYRGEGKRNKETLAVFKADEELQEAFAKWIQRGKLSKLMGLWVKGLDFDWNELYGKQKPRRISLPTYPFARERYWIDSAAPVLAAGAGLGVSEVEKLHPLLHANTSDLHGQRYRTTFTGKEFFLMDHQVRTNGHAIQKVLPAAAYLEMARAAIQAAWPIQPESTILELHDIVWMNPLIVADTRQISIALLANEDEQIEFEVYSQDEEDQIVHCEGRGGWCPRPAIDQLDIDRIKEEIWNEIGQRQLAADAVYAAFEARGFLQGPAFRVIAVLHQGGKQSLAKLHLPESVEEVSREYVLHPSLIDGALQVCAGLLDGWSEDILRPRVPFALDELRILSRCNREMFVWARYSVGSHAADNLLKLDIDLCDESGNVCVQMRGLASRVMNSRIETAGHTRTHDNDSNQPDVTGSDANFDSDYYANIIDHLLNHEVSVDEAVELG